MLKIVRVGELTLHCKTKLIPANVTMKYLIENVISKTIMPGDMISVVASFDTKLADLGISNSTIGKSVSNKIRTIVNRVGFNYDQK